MRCLRILFVLSVSFVNLVYGQGEKVDLSGGVIVALGSESRHVKAGEMLSAEISRRTGVSLSVSGSMPGDSVAAIVLGRVGSFPGSYSLPLGLEVPAGAEGYAIWVDTTGRTGATVYLVGRDDKGVLFAVGRLVRLLYLSEGYVRLDSNVEISTAPAYPIRGQQILRTTQSEDGFVDWYNIPEKEQYILDLALFGNNTIEPKAPSDIDVFCEEYGIDLSVNVGGNKVLELNGLSDEAVRAEYSDLSGVDHFVTYGGDTSSSRVPQDVFPALERIVPLVLEGHSEGKWWYSNQCRDAHAVDYDDFIFDYIQTNEPSWLYGMVYGPWTKRGIPEIRADLPSQYKIRHYPDICHVRWCQYVVPKWDRAFAQVWDRNVSIYAMPRMMRDIHNATCQDTVGFVPYNHTGSFNDLNKFVFSSMGWDPNADVNDILYDYGKAFFSYDYKGCPDGDISGDCIVTFGDYAILANDWLERGYYTTIGGTEPDSLCLWYEFEETSGTTVSDSANGYTGTFFINVNQTPSEISGRIDPGYSGNSFHFSTSIATGGIMIPNSVWTDNGISQDVSVGVWIRNLHPGETPDSGAFMWEFREWDGVSTSGGSRVLAVETRDRNGTFKFLDDGSEVSVAIDWAGHTEWHHYSFVRNSSALKIYVDGLEAASGASSGNVLDAPGLLYCGVSADRAPGNSSNLHDGFTGNMDDFRIYSKALSDEEAVYLADAGTVSVYVPLNSPADMTGDDSVDGNDLCIITDNWLNQPTGTTDELIEECSQAVARGLLLLEDNWRGPLADNNSTEQALELWKDIARNMNGVENNWRLEMFLTKAFIDAQVRRKYDAEMQYQQEAYTALEEADVVGVSAAVGNALIALARIDTEFQSEEAFLGEMEFWGISGKYGDLPGTVDNIYQSLTDRVWLEERLGWASSLADIDAILNYEDAGLGGFYDNLGAEGKQPHLVRQMNWEDDPGFVHSPVEWNDHSPGSSRRQSQLSHATCRYDTPLLMRWEGLDPGGTYYIEVVYRGPFGPEFSCETDDGFIIHGSRYNTGADPVSYSIPAASTSDSVLELEWQLINVVRGVSVTEIWLKKN